MDPCSSLTSQPSWIGEHQVQWRTVGFHPPPRKSKQIWKRHSILASGSHRHPHTCAVGMWAHTHTSKYIYHTDTTPQIHTTMYMHMHASIHSQKRGWGRSKVQGSLHAVSPPVNSCMQLPCCVQKSLLVVIHCLGLLHSFHPAFCRGHWALKGQIWYRCCR